MRSLCCNLWVENTKRHKRQKTEDYQGQINPRGGLGQNYIVDPCEPWVPPTLDSVHMAASLVRETNQYYSDSMCCDSLW